MKQEKLQSLLYSFLENRQSSDDVDGSLGNISEYENPLPFHKPEAIFPQGGISPASPLQFLPFTLTPTQSAEVAVTGRTLAELAGRFSSAYPEKCAVKFETLHKIVPPDEQIISISVVRSDSCANTKVIWKTSDKTAFSGIHYIGSNGEIIFNEGETKKEIEIPILKFQDDSLDLRFRIEISEANGMFTPKPMTITLKKTDSFYDDEQQIINNLPSVPFTVEDLRCVLSDSLTSRTFHLALSHLCSTEDTVPVQLALAFELSRLCLHQFRGESILHILSDFFRMDEIDF